MGLPYLQPRKTLAALKKAIENKKVTFGFIGGSITDARPRHNWPEYFIKQFIEQFPEVRCRVENAAIGATGSDLAVFRSQRDLIERDCDIVFIEFAVNDEAVEPTRRMRTREGLIRQLLKSGIQDIVLVYTYSGQMESYLQQNEAPSSIVDFEELAIYYQLPSIWVGKYGYDQVQQGRISMETWLPDGLHPKEAGSKLYAELVYSFIINEINRNKRIDENELTNIQEPLDILCWEYTSYVPFNALQLKGMWQEYRWHSYEWIDTILETVDEEAELSFTFIGRGAVLVFDYGFNSLEFEYRIDSADWIKSNRECPDWVGADGWYRIYELHTQLPIGEHTIEVKMQKPDALHPNAKHFRIGKVGILL